MIDYARPVRVALFVTCLADTLYPSVGRATVALLERLGRRGRLPARTDLLRTAAPERGVPGCREGARRALRRGLRRLRRGRRPVGVVRRARPLPRARARRRPGRRCGADVRALGARRRPPGSHGRRFRLRRVDHVPPHVPLAARAPCRRSPRVPPACRPRVELRPLPDATECCGFGGTFAVRNADVSSAMLADKLRCVGETGADAVCACDASCLLHIRGGLERHRSPVRAVHLAEVLAT